MGNFGLLFYVLAGNSLENYILMSIPKWQQIGFTEWKNGKKTRKYFLVLLKLL